VIKRGNIYVILPAQTSGWKQFVCQVLRSGIEKNKVLLLFFRYFYLNLLFRKIKNLIVSLNNVSFILVLSGENSKLKAISFLVSRLQNVKQ